MATKAHSTLPLWRNELAAWWRSFLDSLTALLAGLLAAVLA